MDDIVCEQWDEPAGFDGEYADWMPRPVKPAATTVPSAPAPAASDGDGSTHTEATVVSVGKHGWVQVLDADGYTFYYNDTAGLTQWDQPADF